MINFFLKKNINKCPATNYVALTNYSSLVVYNNQLSGCDIALCGRAFFRTAKFL